MSYNLSIKDAGTDSDVFLLDVTADVSTTTSNTVKLSSGIDYYDSFYVSSSSSYIYITVKPKTKKSSGNFALKVTDSSGNSKSIYTN